MRKLIIRKYVWLLAGMLAFAYSERGYGLEIENRDKIHPRIDAHIHLYDIHRIGSAAFLDSVKHRKIYFPHLAKQFSDVAAPAGVEFAVVIEASQRREDNFWLMNLVDSSEVMIAFIANLDPRDPFYVSDLDSLSKSRKFRGIRIRPVHPLNLADPNIIEKFGELEHRGLVLELGGGDIDPEVVSTIARHYPKMNIIIDHLAGGRFYIDRNKLNNWKARLAVFAAEPNVFCKVSALFDLSGQNPAPVDLNFYDPMIDPVVDAFGWERVLFGSNWSLSDMHGSYGDLIRIVDNYCYRKGAPSSEQLFFNNSKRAYKIK